MSDIKNSLESQSVAQSSSAAKKRSKRKHKKKKKSSSAVKGPTPAISDEIRRSNALDYLRQWDTDRQLWSFKKKLQYWLLNNMYDKKQVNKSDFKLLVKYLDGLKGFQRQRVKAVAQEIIETYSNDETIKLKYKRAKKIIELKSE